MKLALCYSGGGMKGAYQEGFIRAFTELGLHPDFIAGNSVGSLNGAMQAMGKLDALYTYWDQVEANGYAEIWDSWLIKEERGTLKGKLGGILEVAVTGRIDKGTGLGTLRPLHEKLRDVVRLNDFAVPFRCGVSSLATGTYHSIDPATCQDDETMVNALVASSTMPLIWEPVERITTGQGELTQLVDGGMLSITPITEAIDYINSQADAADWMIVVVTCSTDRIEPHPDPYERRSAIAGRSLDMLLSVVFNQDLSRFALINELVKASGKPQLGKYRCIPSRIIMPSAPLGSTLDSSREAIQKRRALGYRDGISQLRQLKQPINTQ